MFLEEKSLLIGKTSKTMEKQGVALIVIVAIVALVAGYFYVQSSSQQSSIPQEEITPTAASARSSALEITASSCTPTQKTDEYGDISQVNQIRFSGTAEGSSGLRLNAFLIGGGGVPADNALECASWEKVSGVNACISDSPSTAWSFYWEDYSPHTTEYSMRATFAGMEKTSIARCST